MIDQRIREILYHPEHSVLETEKLDQAELIPDSLGSTKPSTFCPYCGIRLTSDINLQWYKVHFLESDFFGSFYFQQIALCYDEESCLLRRAFI